MRRSSIIILSSDFRKSTGLKTIMLVFAIFVARVTYLWLFNAWELAADEAHYWEWSRHLDWSYYTKGPGVAWVIRLSTHLFGISEASVRLPSATASALMTFAGARLAYEIAGRSTAAAFNTVLALTLAPAYFMLAQLMTIDIFWTAGWVIATWFVFAATRPDATRVRRLTNWLAAGFMVGLTCLFKYTALLYVPGVILFLVVRRRDFRWDRTLGLSLVGSVAALLIAGSPIAIWNASRGWPTIAHQVGRIRLPGGDESVDWSWSPSWFLTFAGAQVALLGVVGAVLIVLAVRHERRRRAIEDDAIRRIGTSLLTCVSLPLVVCYLVLSIFRETQGNWAVAGYSTWLVLVGISVTDALRERATLVREWHAKREGDGQSNARRRRPRTPMQVWWHWYLCIGAIAGVVILAGPRLVQLPGLGRIDAIRRAVARISGAQQRAIDVAAIADAHADASGRPPLFIADRYQDASLLAFYMPGHPVVYSAASYLGSRRNAYDFFDDTNLAAASLRSREALLIGGNLNDWAAALGLRDREIVGVGKKIWFIQNFEGLARHEHHD